MCSLSANKTDYWKQESDLTHSRIASRNITWLVWSSLPYISICIICWSLSLPFANTSFTLTTLATVHPPTHSFCCTFIQNTLQSPLWKATAMHHSMAIICRAQNHWRNDRICILLQRSVMNWQKSERFKPNLTYTGLNSWYCICAWGKYCWVIFWINIPFRRRCNHSL